MIVSVGAARKAVYTRPGMLLYELALLTAGGAVLLGAFLGTRLLTRRHALDTSERLLGLLIVACTLNAAHPALTRLFGLPINASGQFFEPLEFLLAPLLAAYAKAACGGEMRWRARQALHVLPFFVAVGVSIGFTFHGQAPLTVSILFWAALSVQMLAYLGPALRRFHRYRDTLTDSVSNLARVDLGWLERFFWLSAGLCLLALVVLVLLLHDHDPLELALAVSLCLTAALWILGSRGLEHETPELTALDTKEVESKDRPPMGADETRELGLRVEALFATEKPHLDPDLDLGALARLAQVPRNQLSYAINTELGRNFYDLVNGWRLEEFRSLAADPARDKDKILTLAFDAGFNSKPTFNKVARKLTGKTPSELRQEAIASRRAR